MDRGLSALISVEVWRANKQGWLISDLSNNFVQGKVSYNEDRAVKMGCDITLRNATLLTGFVDYVVPIVQLEYENGDIVKERLGHYMFDVPQVDADFPGSLMTIAGMDMTNMLALSTFSAPYTLRAGSSIVASIRNLIISVGFFNHDIQNKDAVLGEDLTFPAATSKLDAINLLLNAIGYYVLYATRSGWLLGRPIISIADRTAYATYTEDELLSSPKIKPLTTTLANKVTVVKDNPSGNPIISSWINDDPQSRTSILPPPTGIGIEISRTITNSNIVTQADADALVMLYAEQGSSYYETLTLEVPADPTIDPHVAIQLNYVTEDGYDCTGKYLVRTFEHGLDEQNISLKMEVNRIRPFGGTLS